MNPMSRPLVSILLALVAASPFASLEADVVEVDETALAALIGEGATIVDVRREDEWRERGVLEGAHRITFFDRFGRYDVESWLDELDALVERDEKVVLICARGVRSRRIADLLDTRLGFESVHNVTDGFEGWVESGGERVPYRREGPLSRAARRDRPR